MCNAHLSGHDARPTLPLDADMERTLGNSCRHLQAIQHLASNQDDELLLSGEDIYFLIAPVLAELQRINACLNTAPVYPSVVEDVTDA